MDRNDSSDAALDADNDGISNKDEAEMGTNPQRADSDGDGISDAIEATNNMDPTDGTDATIDSDGDGISNGREIEKGITQMQRIVMGTVF